MTRWGAETLDRLSRGRFDRVFRVAAAAALAGIAIQLVVLVVSGPGLSRAAFPIARPGWLAAAAVLAILPWFAAAGRLALWSAAAGRRIRYLDALRIGMAVELGAAAAPPTAGNIVVKLGLLVRSGHSAAGAGALVVWGTLEDALFFLLALPVAFRFSTAWDAPAVVAARGAAMERLPETAAVTSAVLALLGASLFVLVRAGRGANPAFRLPGRWGAALRGLARRAVETGRVVVGFTRAGRRILGPSFVLTALQWSARYSVVTALAAAFGAPVDPLLLFALQWVVFTVSGLLPTPGGIGGAEGAFLAVGAPLFGPAVLPGLLALWRFATFHGLLLIDAAALSLLGPGDASPAPTGAPRGDALRTGVREAARSIS